MCHVHRSPQTIIFALNTSPFCRIRGRATPPWHGSLSCLCWHSLLFSDLSQALRTFVHGLEKPALGTTTLVGCRPLNVLLRPLKAKVIEQLLLLALAQADASVYAFISAECTGLQRIEEMSLPFSFPVRP